MMKGFALVFSVVVLENLLVGCVVKRLRRLFDLLDGIVIVGIDVCLDGSSLRSRLLLQGDRVMMWLKLLRKGLLIDLGEV